jgi:hypothetical protein
VTLCLRLPAVAGERHRTSVTDTKTETGRVPWHRGTSLSVAVHVELTVPQSSPGRIKRQLTAATDSSVLAEADLGSIFDVTAGLILVSSRPREPIEKPWMRMP